MTVKVSKDKHSRTWSLLDEIVSQTMHNDEEGNR